MRVLGAVLYPDFELLDLFGPLEMFGCLGKELKIVTIAETRGPIKSAQGPATIAEYDYKDHPPLDLALLPGGWGTIPQLDNPKMMDFIIKLSSSVNTLMSVCTGSALLAKAGVLDGKRATSNKMFFSLATGQSEKVDWIENARWVEDGNIVTASGVSAGTDMALGVIARLYGRERAENLAVLSEYEWHADSTRDPFARYLNQGKR